MTEKEFLNKIVNRLLKHFTVSAEVWSESKVGANYDLYNDGLHILNYEKSIKW